MDPAWTLKPVDPGSAYDLYLMLHPYGWVVAAEIGLPANASDSPTFT